MAQLMHALKAYSPRLKLGNRVSMNEVVSFISGRTNLNKGMILMMLCEIKDALVFFHQTGRSVKLEGLGCYTPKIDFNGKIDISHRIPSEFKAELNKPHAFKGEIINRDMIGKSVGEIITRWNEEHPDDKINID
jgi:hypothetical protein